MRGYPKGCELPVEVQVQSAKEGICISIDTARSQGDNRQSRDSVSITRFSRFSSSPSSSLDSSLNPNIHMQFMFHNGDSQFLSQSTKVTQKTCLVLHMAAFHLYK